MNVSRRDFLGLSASAGAAFLAPGCCSLCCCGGKGKPAVQLYSIRDYIKKVGLEKALADVRAIGYEAVEFAGYWGKTAKELKKILADNGLVACGTHHGRDAFSPEKFAKTCEFELEYGNTFICCPGGGNMPPKWGWDGNGTPSKESDDFIKMLCDYYNKAAENCAKYGCKIGLHNHMWEFQIKMTDGTLYWDYFFKNTDKSVLMEQDVGWTTCAGFDPCEQYKKYPGRSLTLHAKENGMGKGVKEFNAILGQPGKPGAVGVNWDGVCAAAEADGVKWWVVECERLCDSLNAIKPSFDFLRSNGYV
jgi:sugar phosphate isomerase/epimerase